MTTVGTFNIRLFPDRGTLASKVVERIVALDADLFAVQEIRVPSAFDAVLSEVSASTGRDYAVALGPMCRASELQLGVVYDQTKFSLVHTRVQAELDPSGRCSCRDGHPPALLAILEGPGGQRLAAMSVHLQFGGRRWQYRARRDQWANLVDSIQRISSEFGAPVVVAGDFNSTGFREDDLGERTFIKQTTAEAGISLATASLSCTAYWRPNRRLRDYVPSMLDHVLVLGATVRDVEALGMCATLGGRVSPEAAGNPDFHEVSDHCPVRVELAL